jgi:hypothetical protein
MGYPKKKKERGVSQRDWLMWIGERRMRGERRVK